MEYENCKAYKIKEPANGICRGNDNDIGEYDEKCNTCPAYLRYKNVLRMEKVINELNECIEHIRKNKFNKIPFWGNCQIAMMDALELLDKQDSEKKRILKIVWDTLHEGLSIDTVSDQDWVYERIRNRIEGTYPEV